MSEEEVKIDDILINHKCGKTTFAKVIGIGSDSVGVIIDGKKDSIMFTQLHHWRKFICPIKEGRIVSSKTFAVRFKQFLEWIPQSWVWSQPHYVEEYDYLMYIAKSLLQYQILTVTEEEEKDYLKYLKLI